LARLRLKWGYAIKKGNSILRARLTPLQSAVFLPLSASCGVEEDAAPLPLTNGADKYRGTAPVGAVPKRGYDSMNIPRRGSS